MNLSRRIRPVEKVSAPSINYSTLIEYDPGKDGDDVDWRADGYPSRDNPSQMQRLISAPGSKAEKLNASKCFSALPPTTDITKHERHV
jgi:hypothetical protein